RVRLLLRGDAAAALAELRVRALAVQSDITFHETLHDGRYGYQVVAVDQVGLQSAPSAAAEVTIGDVVPPPPVVLSGRVNGRDAHLEWTASDAADLARYRVYRGTAPVEDIDADASRVHDEMQLPNGTYSFHVTALDAIGNESAASNEVTLTVAVPPPGAPRDLVAA